MKYLITLFILLAVSCGEQAAEVEAVSDEVYDDFQSVLTSGDVVELSRRLDPEVLKAFRMSLDFEGAWVTHQPPKSEIETMGDRKFFERYMRDCSEALGNPFTNTYRGSEVIAMTAGSRGYRHYVVTWEEEYSFPMTFSFRQVDGKWYLVEPSFVSQYADRIRKSKGQ